MRRATLLLTLLFAGCSAIVTIDPGELGGDGGTRRDNGVNPDSGMACEGGCDDEVSCTTDRCVAGVCIYERDNAFCESGERCDAVDGCVSAACADNDECDDGLACNGVETCNGGICANGTPIECDDGVGCTADQCDDRTGECSHDLNDVLCDDGFDCTLDVCLAAGCDNRPNDTLCNDGFCNVDGICRAGEGCVGSTPMICDDELACTLDNCDPVRAMCVAEIIDGDGDGFGPAEDCAEIDCDDANGDIYPGAEERCNDMDDDCDGRTDEGVCRLPDTCDNAQVLEFGDTGMAMVTARYGSFTDDYRSRCGGDEGRDAVYAIDIVAGLDYIVELSGIGVDGLPSAMTDPTLAVHSSCGDWRRDDGYARRGCNDDATGSGALDSRLYLRNLEPGRYYLLVDEFRAGFEAAGFQLRVLTRSAAPEGCEAAPNISAGGTVIGRIVEDSPTNSTECDMNGDAREAYFAFVPIDNTATADLWSGDFSPSIYPTTDCEDSFTGPCDRDRDHASISLDRTPGLLVVDGASAGDLYSLRYKP